MSAADQISGFWSNPVTHGSQVSWKVLDFFYNFPDQESPGK